MIVVDTVFALVFRKFIFGTGNMDNRQTTSQIIPAWEPRAAQVTKCYSRRLPALKRFTGKPNFRYKSRPTRLSASKQAKNTPHFPNQNQRQIGPRVSELLSDKQRNKKNWLELLIVKKYLIRKVPANHCDKWIIE